MRSLQTRLQDTTRAVAEFFQDQWFDRTRRVRTSGNVPLVLAGIPAHQVRDSELYVPARPGHIREALHAIPAVDLSNYTYIDLGSGKGRTLFIAAELPFRRIIGIEFSDKLHEIACRNIATFSSGKRNAPNIECIHRDAADFQFPDGPLVLYMFNPFGAATMQRVLDNLASSLLSKPRHVIITLLWPRCGPQVARLAGMHLTFKNEHLEIFEAHAPSVTQPAATKPAVAQSASVKVQT